MFRNSKIILDPLFYNEDVMLKSIVAEDKLKVMSEAYGTRRTR